jgi:hypothetical protein
MSTLSAMPKRICGRRVIRVSSAEKYRNAQTHLRSQGNSCLFRREILGDFETNEIACAANHVVQVRVPLILEKKWCGFEEFMLNSQTSINQGMKIVAPTFCCNEKRIIQIAFEEGALLITSKCLVPTHGCSLMP